MKVAFDHSVFTLQRYGGVSRYFFELGARMPGILNAELSVVAPFHINDYLVDEAISKYVHGWRVPYRWRGVDRLIRMANGFSVPLAWMSRNTDIIHETYYTTRPVGRSRIRIVTVYDMIHELFPEALPDARYVSAAKRKAVARADHVICISHNTRKDLLEMLDTDASKVSVTHLGYELTGVGQEPAVLARPYLLYVGGRSGYKNFAALLEAYASSRDLKETFDLVAFGGGSFDSQTEADLKQRDLSRSVRQVSGDDSLLSSYYRGATLFVYPSLYEGFGIPPLEAMSCGCPVAASRTSSIPEVAGDAAAYFDPRDIDDMKRTLETLALSNSLLEKHRVLGERRIHQFSWHRCASETAEIYRRLCG